MVSTKKNTSNQGKVLLLDNDGEKLKLLSEFILKCGYNIYYSPIKNVSFQLFSNKIPDLILIDFSKNIIKIQELCNQLKLSKKTKNIPVILLGVTNNIEEKERAFKIGCSNFITEPYSYEEVYLKINKYLNLIQSFGQLEQQLVEKNKKLNASNDKLTESEEKFHLVFNQIPYILEIFTPDGTTVMVNEQWEKTYRAKKETVIGKFNILKDHQIKKMGLLPQLKKAFNGEIVILPDSKFDPEKSKQIGRKRWLRTKAIPIKDSKEKVKLVAIMHEDITEQKLADDKLKQKENYFRSLLYNMHEDIIVIDRNYKITDVNNTFLITTGYSRKHVIGKHCFAVSHGYNQPCDKNGEDCKLKEVFKTGKFQNCYHIHKSAEGTDVHVDILLSPLKDDKGNITHVIEAIRDITDIKTVEDSLRKSEQKYRNLVESSSDWIWELNTDGVYTYSSPKIEELLGYKPEDIIGKTPVDFMSEEKARKASKKLTSIIKSKKPFFNNEIVKRHKNGNEIIVESTGIPFFDHKNELVGYRGVNRNITARRLVEKERSSYMNFLKNLNQINTIIQKSNNINKVLWDVLKEILSIYKCDRAWLLYPCEPNTPYLKAITEVNSKKYPGAFKKGDNILKYIGPHEICEVVLNNKQPVCFGVDEKYKIPPIITKEYNVLSQLAMAIYPKTGKPWVFGIQQCSHYRNWTKDEISLFNEIGRRIEDSLSLLLVYRDLQVSEEKYRALFENSPLGIYRTTPDGKILMANPALLKMLDYDSLEDLQEFNLEKDLDQKIYPRPEFKKMINQRGTVSGFLTKFIKKDGTTIDVNENARAIKDDNDKILFYEGWVQDITLRKKVEKALSESEQKFRNLFNSSSDGIIITNQDYDILAINKTFMKMTGFNEKQLINSKITEFITPQYINKVKLRIKLLYEDKIQTPIEIKFFQKSGETIPVEVNSKIIYYENSKVILTILRDISFRKETERKILNTIIETEEKEKEKFAKDLHDGLGPLLSASKIYSKSIQLAEDEKERIQTIKKLEETINDAIQSVQEISNNLSPHVLKNLGLVAAIEAFYKKISDATPLKIAFGTNLEIRIPEKIEITLYRVAVELINNTLKHSNATTVLLKLLHEGNNLFLHYSDDGKGFNLDKTLSKNTGMGLSNIISRIKSLNGEITMDSTINKGYRVEIKIVL